MSKKSQVAAWIAVALAALFMLNTAFPQTIRGIIAIFAEY
jgi:hypothetical protein